MCTHVHADIGVFLFFFLPLASQIFKISRTHYKSNFYRENFYIYLFFYIFFHSIMSSRDLYIIEKNYFDK